MTVKEKNRQKKYPNTNTFHWYNANPKGKITGDCAIRAICTGLDRPYVEVYKELFENSIKTGYSIASSQNIDSYLKLQGWIKHKQPKKEDNTKYRGYEFCERARHYERYIANIGGHHIVAIVDGKVNDIWDSTHKCIGNYWTKE